MKKIIHKRFKKFLTFVVPFYKNKKGLTFVPEWIVYNTDKNTIKQAKKYRDKQLTLAISILFFIGVLFIASATMYTGYDGKNEWLKQLIYGLVGFIGYISLSRLPENFWIKHGPMLFALTIMLLLLVFTPLGHEENGSNRWIKIGSFTLQPSEFFRVTAIILLCIGFSKYSHKVKGFWNLIFNSDVTPYLFAAMFGWVLIIFQGDIEIILLIVILSLFFSAEYTKKALRNIIAWIAGAFSFVIVLLPIMLATTRGVLQAYQLERITAWLDPWADPLGGSYQVINSVIAFVNGGITGVGLGKGTQKSGYVPYPQADFILSTIGEEIGFIGVVFVAGIFLWLIFILLKNSKNVDSKFGRLILITSAFYMLSCLIINYGGVTGFIPMTGMPLPFISYGVSALWANLILMGVCQSIIVSDKRRKKVNEKAIISRR